jgi:hypothetical protein
MSRNYVFLSNRDSFHKSSKPGNLEDSVPILLVPKLQKFAAENR